MDELSVMVVGQSIHVFSRVHLFDLHLPAGKSLVDLLAYEVRPHFGVAEILNEPLRARGFVGMQGQRVVTVGP